MAPLGQGLFARRCPSNRGDLRRRFEHPQTTHSNLAFPPAIPKCEPALCPHPHVFNCKDENGIEVSSEVLERTVTPEAHSYFLRIVKVTQSEVEKLLVYKIQQLLAAPVAPEILGETALEELGTPVTKRLQIPGASITAHAAEMEGRKSCGSIRHRSVQEKAVAEGRELTKYVVSMMGRILADFGRFADTVLRWQLEDGELYSGDARENKQSTSFPLTEPEISAKTANGFKDLLERLERQDQQNSELEAKYSKVTEEQRADRRAFMRERQLWREQLRQLKARVKRSGDPSLASLLDRDVQFFDGGEGRPTGEEEDIEDLRQRYEERIASMQEDHEEKVEELESLLEKLRGKLQALEERPLRKVSDTKSEASAEMEELIRQLRQEAEASKADYESLQCELDKMRSMLQEALEERSRLQDALSKYYADLESRPAVAPVAQHASVSTQAPENRSGRLKKQILRSNTINIPSIELPAAQDEDAHARMLELEKLLLEAEARAAANRKELLDKTTQYDLLVKDHAEQKLVLEKATQYTKRPLKLVASQTDPWQPDDETIKEKEQLLETLRRRNMELEAICQDRQLTIDKLREQLAEAMERIKLLEAVPAPEEDSPPPPVIKGSRKGSKGGGWVLVRRKDLGSTLPESQDEKKFWLPTSWPTPANKMHMVQKRGGMPLDFTPRKDHGLDDSYLSNLAKVCGCGNIFLEDSIFCRKCGVRRPGIGLNESTERRALPGVNMPVSGYVAAQSQHQTGAPTDAQDYRHAYGGGFNVLDTTAWKGADRQDVQPIGEGSKALSQLHEHQAVLEESSAVVQNSIVGAGHTRSAPDLTIRTSQSDTRPRSGNSGVSASTSSLRDGFDRRPKSAALITSAQGVRSHPSYLHGPIDRSGRPHSAVGVPLLGESTAQKEGTRRRPSSSLPRVDHAKPQASK